MPRSVEYKVQVTTADYVSSDTLTTDSEWLARETLRVMREAGHLAAVFITTSYVGTHIITSESEWKS